MINHGKRPVLGVNIDAVDYRYAVSRIVEHARRQVPYAVSALAVHGVMTGFQDRVHRRRLNGLDLVVPDGQPVRWALRWLHGVNLPDRVYGPDLTLKTIDAAAAGGLPVYFYGSTAATLERLVHNLQHRAGGLRIAGYEPSRFRRLQAHEKEALVTRIRESGARIVFVGLGCPRQEVWAYEYRKVLSMPILAVGAAFDFHAGSLSQAPGWMQARGLEWLYRLAREPRRLWRRYLVLNPLYLTQLVLEMVSLRDHGILLPDGTEPEEHFG